MAPNSSHERIQCLPPRNRGRNIPFGLAARSFLRPCDSSRCVSILVTCARLTDQSDQMHLVLVVPLRAAGKVHRRSPR